MIRTWGIVLAGILSAFTAAAPTTPESASVISPPVALIDRELRSIVHQNSGCEIPSKPITTSSARLFYWKAKYTPLESERLKILEGALILAEQARTKNPIDPGALYDWIAIKGELASLKNKLVALTYIKPLEKAALSLKKIAPEYEGYAADRILGYLYDNAPSFISIGSSKKAREHYLLALAGAPHYPANGLSYAEFLLRKGDKVGAMFHARDALADNSADRYPLEAAAWGQQGEAIFLQTDDLSTPR